MNHLQLGERDSELEQVCPIVLASLHIWIVESRSRVHDMYGELDRDVLVEHVHAKFDSSLFRQHCTHIHHRCLI